MVSEEVYIWLYTKRVEQSPIGLRHQYDCLYFKHSLEKKMKDHILKAAYIEALLPSQVGHQQQTLDKT